MKRLIVFVVIIGVAAVVGSIVVGMKSFDGTVAENPYEEGLRWDETQKQLQNGMTAELDQSVYSVGENRVVVILMGEDGEPAAFDTIAVLRSRPASSNYDKQFYALRGESGTYEATVPFPLPGLWDLVIRAGDSTNMVLFVKKIIVENERREND